MSLTVKRESLGAGIVIRWVEFDCGLPLCIPKVLGGVEHYAMLAAVEGQDRWVALDTETRGREVEMEQGVWEAEIEGVGAVRQAIALLGLPWDHLELPRQLMVQSNLSVHGPEDVLEEMQQHTPAQLMRLRSYVGADLTRVGPLLRMLGEYRGNVGGVRSTKGLSW